MHHGINIIIYSVMVFALVWLSPSSSDGCEKVQFNVNPCLLKCTCYYAIGKWGQANSSSIVNVP
jgi:hypothetical protein